MCACTRRNFLCYELTCQKLTFVCACKNYFLDFFVLLMLSIRGSISFATVPCRLSRSLCIIAEDCPNSPIFPRIACCSLSIEVSILFSLSSMLSAWF